MKHILFTTALIAFITGQTAFADIAVPPRSYYVKKEKENINNPSISLDDKLYNAVQFSELKDEVISLIKQGANVNFSKWGKPPLLYADSKEIAEVLIENGADIHMQMKDNLNLVEHMLIIIDPNIDIIQLLLEKGAIIDYQKKWVQLALEGFSKYRYPIIYSSRRKKPIDTVSIMQVLLKNGLDPNIRLEPHNTLLHITRDEVIAQLLIKFGADVNAKNDKGETALFHASPEFAKILIENGADVNAKNNKGETILDVVLETNHMHTIQWLIEKGADINAKNNKGETILDVALETNNMHTIQWLIEKGADINKKDSNGNSILHHLVQKRFFDIDIFNLFLKKGLDINAQNNEGNTPLHTVIQKAGVRNQHVVKFLLESGANPNIQNKLGETPLHLAARIHFFEPNIKMLIQKGADKSIKDNNGKTAADYVRNPKLKTLLSPQEN